MAENQKRVFWEALILSVFVFSIGVALGFYIESSRADKITDIYTNSEINLLDIKLQSQLYDLSGIDCDAAAEENLRFGDSIYSEARTLERYENAQRLSESLTFQHKKYDILRVSFWLNSIKIRERCNSTYHTILYIYQYNDPSIEQKAKQSVFSNLLAEVKAKKGSDVALVPIAGDLNLSSIELIKRIYKIDKLPAILIDQDTKITDLQSSEQILNILQ